MKCPSCGGELKPESVAGFDYSYRCEKCGGFWVANWVVNNLADGKKMGIEPRGGKTEVGSGTNMCPTDKVQLVAPAKESLPEGLAVEKCNQCGWWWFPGDEIFKFSQAFSARKEYVKQWRKSDWQVYAWPALVLVLMVAGLTGSVVLVRTRQRSAIEAMESVKDLTIVAVGDMIEVRFKTDKPVGVVEYKKLEESRYRSEAVRFEGGFYVVKIDGLENGQYAVRVLGREYRVEIKQ